MDRLNLVIFALLFAGLPGPAAAQNNVDGFSARVYRNGAGQSMPYRLFTPKAYDKEREYPLILWLHGAGSVGSDNLKQISGASLRGTHVWTTPQNQMKHPAFVLAPQSPASWANFRSGELSREMILVLEILAAVRTEFRIDPSRIYVAGQSMGGYGTWDLITKRPDLFAAAIPLCGGGDTARGEDAARTPTWAFHGDSDPTVPVSRSRDMIAAIRKAGGNPRYTEYKGVGHDVWVRAVREPGLVDWLFAQHK
jgi:predicted peptidase